MIIKQVKEYQGRQRIEINKSEQFEADTNVAIIPLEAYQETQTDIDDLEKMLLDIRKELTTLRTENKLLKEQIEIYKQQEISLKEIIEDVTNPIHETYKNELKKKDKEIAESKGKLDALEHECTNYNLELNGFNGFELVVMRKHKKLVKQFNGTIDLIMKRSDPKIVEADATAIPGEQHDNKTTKQ